MREIEKERQRQRQRKLPKGMHANENIIRLGEKESINLEVYNMVRDPACQYESASGYWALVFANEIACSL